MSLITGTADNFEQEVLKSDAPVLVDFNASWCPPCQAMHPILEELAEEYKVVAVDIEDEEQLARAYEVSGIPCFVLFKDGEEIDRRVGMQSKKRLIKMLEQ